MDIQIGQQWRTRGGEVVTVSGGGSLDFPFWIDGQDSYTVDNDGMRYPWEQSRHDLIELVAAAPVAPPTPPAPAQPDTLRLTIAASIYAGMLASEGPVIPDDAEQTMRVVARRALSHADILIQEAAR